MTSTSPEINIGPAWAPFSALGRFVFRFRDQLTAVVAVLVLWLTRPLPSFGDQEADCWVDLAGVLVALSGQGIRATVIGYAYIVRGGVNKQLAAPRLVCEGFYAHSRNPMYLGNFLLLGGLSLIYNSPLVYLVGLPLCIVALLSIVRAEEEFLRARFGAEYDAYCRSVNRFLPDIRGLRATLSQMHFDWRRVLRKEYGTTFAWVSAAFVFSAVEQIAWHGVTASQSALLRLGVGWLAVALCYAVVRWLKKSGRLDSTASAPG
jgi:protein-S-isoprenylcysteine O-methyltransferase Ste14